MDWSKNMKVKFYTYEAIVDRIIHNSVVIETQVLRWHEMSTAIVQREMAGMPHT